MGLEAKGTFPFQMYQIPEFTATTVTTAPTPPAKISIDKPKVVEPATRSEVTIRLDKYWQEKAEELLNRQRSMAELAYSPNGRIVAPIDVGRILDVEV